MTTADHRPRPPAGSRRSAASTRPSSASSCKRMLRNRRTIIFTLVFPAALFLVVRRQPGLGRHGRPRQRRGVHHGLDGAVRRRADRRGRRRDGRHRARAGLVAPAPADPAQPGRLHPDEGDRRPGHGRASRSPSSTSSASSRASPRCRSHVWVACAAGDAGLHPGLRRARRLRRLPGARARTRCRSSAPAWRCCPSSAGVFIPIDRRAPRSGTSPSGRRCTASPRSPGRR